jgi:thioester reductase-like protein
VVDLGELCADRGQLEYLMHVSTAYVAGTHCDRFAEHELDVGQGFRNAYELSKFRAERLVHERGATLPVQIVRPSIVVGDSRSGWTAAFNVVYAPLRAFSAGALRRRRGRAEAAVPVPT